MKKKRLKKREAKVNKFFVRVLKFSKINPEGTRGPIWPVDTVLDPWCDEHQACIYLRKHVKDQINILKLKLKLNVSIQNCFAKSERTDLRKCIDIWKYTLFTSCTQKH